MKEEKTIQDEIEIQRCTGDCCRKFSLPFTPKELRDLFTGRKKHKYNIAEMKQIVLMVKFLETSRIHVNGKVVENDIQYYTCRNLNKETGDCKIYEHRPRMCSSYPYKRKCEYPGCTRKVKIVENSEESVLELNKEDVYQKI